YGGPAPHVAPCDRQSSLRTKSVLGEISIAPSAPQRPAFVQPSLCGGFAPHKLLIRFRPVRIRRQIKRIATIVGFGGFFLTLKREGRSISECLGHRPKMTPQNPQTPRLPRRIGLR